MDNESVSFVVVVVVVAAVVVVVECIYKPYVFSHLVATSSA